jgi:hypothetical protein
MNASPRFHWTVQRPGANIAVNDRASLCPAKRDKPAKAACNRTGKDLIRRKLETIQKVNKMKYDNSIVQTTFHSPLGEMIIAATDKGLAGTWFAGQRHLPPQLVKPYVWPENPDHPVLKQTIAQLTEYYAGTRTTLTCRWTWATARPSSNRCGRRCWPSRKAAP